MEIKIGLTHEQEKTVTHDDSALVVGSGSVDVFATPALIAFVEKTASSAILQYLSPEDVTVGCDVTIKHIAASPIGALVKCTVQVIKIEKNKVFFRVVVTENGKIIALGNHIRCIVNKQRFMGQFAK